MKDSQELKRMTVDDAVAQITDNMILGIGTGSTIELLIPKIAERIKDEQLNITGVCTSNKSEYLAKQLNMNIVDINDVSHVDLAIDGADEVDPQLNLVKGGGGALFREKVIDEMAARFVVLVDEGKMVDYLGQNFKLPVEVDKFNWLHTTKKIESYGKIQTERRMNGDVPFITDNGNYIIDCQLNEKIDPYEFHEFLIHLTGVLETGYFLDITDQVIVGTQQGVQIINK
ncbi:ribose-5-phosphate isomerase A [Staphylococcus petrasii]|uniref:Ribose-5-phosphate isomerase A n=1 Tax=Staphylococcus petrasii TaxID=1276936 RepID=A0A380FWQ9_9STAP|nr:ribose 5-phosphate isomerase A [Staphylococcus petrasii]MCI2774758.1 ribose 5-phosphate isomerase A [Staphylococcus petrasii]PNZ26805.1 ribose-5-phosphate isomerase [Staphylococcus petrasii]PNZ84369.1 ribose-5-phosphate isomerase [Staphylococcus petrasii]TGA81813.1 ribose 5-phosphate isomerase A [Staphylococcus petrasii]TGE12058.1 ribose 5-phosphate isomerase A [Staphylococcus petrasii]